MQYKSLGKTDIKVSHVCLGTMTWGCQNTADEAHEQMDYAVEQGINYLDTAELYAVPPEEHTQGLTETYIGTWFAKTGKRQDIVLASKAAGNGPTWIHDGQKLSRNKINMALEGSLKRLQTDYIDLYQLHWPSYPYPHHGKHGAGMIDHTQINTAEETDRILDILTTLDEAIKSGKIRAYGLSNDTPWGMMKYNELAKANGFAPVTSIQNEYSLICRVDEPYVAEVCVHENISYLPYSPLAAGALSGKYINGARPEGSRLALPQMKTNARGVNRTSPDAEKATRAYRDLANKHGLDVCQMALAFCYQQPFITSTIIGATTMEQLKSNIAAKDIHLSEAVSSEIHDIYKQYPMPY